jgi:hypothetical protein
MHVFDLRSGIDFRNVTGLGRPVPALPRLALPPWGQKDSHAPCPMFKKRLMFTVSSWSVPPECNTRKRF